MLQFAAAPYTDTDLPIDTTARADFVKEELNNIVAAGRMVYVDQYDRDAAGLAIRVYEAAGRESAREKWEEVATDYNHLIKAVKNRWVTSKHIDASKLPGGSEDLPENARVYAATITTKQKNESLMVFNSMIIEGNYLIVVSSADNFDLNKKALLETLRQLRKVG